MKTGYKEEKWTPSLWRNEKHVHWDDKLEEKKDEARSKSEVIDITKGSGEEEEEPHEYEHEEDDAYRKETEKDNTRYRLKSKEAEDLSRNVRDAHKSSRKLREYDECW